MTEIRIRATGEVLSQQDYVLRYPNVSFAENFTPTDADRITPKNPPAAAAHQRAVRAGVKQSGGKWVEAWTLQTLTADELAQMESVKAAEKRALTKKRRAELIEQLVVHVGSKTFNGDETSQMRMLRKIFDMEGRNENSAYWTLADNSRVEVTVAELRTALAEAETHQSAMWTIEL